MNKDRPLVEAAQNGDTASFNALVTTYRDMVYSLALGYLNDFDTAYDISQEVFLQAWLRVKTLKYPDKFPAWLRTLTVNTCKMWVRRQKSTVEIGVVDRAAATTVRTSESPEAIYERKEQRRQVLHALARLSTGSRTVLTLYYLNDHTARHIADLLNLSHGAVRQRLHRARQQLKQEILHMVKETIHEEAPDDQFNEQIQQYITDTLFKEAVALVDAGDVDALAVHLDQHPHLLSEKAKFSETFFISGTQPGQYFEHPKLLWFVAENPIRHSTFTDHIVDVIQCIVDRQRKHSPDALQDDLDYTLALVTSGNVPRETGRLTELVSVLVKNGADPNCAEAALAHGERDAVQALLDAGADVDLLIAAGMGLEDDLRRLVPDADAETKQKALACAANCGQPVTSRVLIEQGADPNQFNPDGFHAHCTPLHSAISADSYETVAALIDCGADPTIKDRMHDGDALGWAEHMARHRLAELIKAAL